MGDFTLQIRKLHVGSFLPLIIDPRCRLDQTLHVVIKESCTGGFPTRKVVDSLVAPLGFPSGIAKSQVSPICQDINHQMQPFLGRSPESSSYPSVYLVHATYLKDAGQGPAGLIPRGRRRHR